MVTDVMMIDVYVLPSFSLNILLIHFESAEIIIGVGSTEEGNLLECSERRLLIWLSP